MNSRYDKRTNEKYRGKATIVRGILLWGLTLALWVGVFALGGLFLDHLFGYDVTGLTALTGGILGASIEAVHFVKQYTNERTRNYIDDFNENYENDA